MNIVWNIFLLDILEEINIKDLKEENIPNENDQVFFSVQNNPSNTWYIILRNFVLTWAPFFPSLF